MRKIKDLLIISAIYIVAFAVGVICCFNIQGIMLKLFVFDIIATIVTFVFSVIFKNSSVYDAYWSLTPMIMSIWIFVAARAFSFWQLLFLLVFNIWSIRLTLNWITVFTDFSYEDWRYKKFRNENPPLIWAIINFFGIHLIPTLVVFAGMLPLFKIANSKLNVLSLPGILIISVGIAFEFFADRQMHAFLNTAKAKTTCSKGLWNFSRHPNYLGEILIWVGTYLTMLPFSVKYWYYGVGALCVALLFNVVSIPLMEKRQKQRRSDYEAYCKTTSRLLILPHKS